MKTAQDDEGRIYVSLDGFMDLLIADLTEKVPQDGVMRCSDLVMALNLYRTNIKSKYYEAQIAEA